jgi:hypothetical protein
MKTQRPLWLLAIQVIIPIIVIASVLIAQPSDRRVLTLVIGGAALILFINSIDLGRRLRK